MATYGGYNYTNFRAVNFKDGIFKLEGSGYHATFAVDTLTGDRAITFSNRSGKMATAGSFKVVLPSSIKGMCQATAVTVSGISAEDAIVCSPYVTTNDGIAGATLGSARVLVSAYAGAGVVNLVFCNLSNSEVAETSFTVNYAVVR